MACGKTMGYGEPMCTSGNECQTCLLVITLEDRIVRLDAQWVVAVRQEFGPPDDPFGMEATARIQRRVETWRKRDGK